MLVHTAALSELRATEGGISRTPPTKKTPAPSKVTTPNAKTPTPPHQPKSTVASSTVLSKKMRPELASPACASA